MKALLGIFLLVAVAANAQVSWQSVGVNIAPVTGGGTYAVTNYYVAPGSNISVVTNVTGTNVTWTITGSGGAGTVGTVINTTAGTAGAPLVLQDATGTNAVPSYAGEPFQTVSTNYTITYTDNGKLLLWNSATNCTVFFGDGATNGFNVTIKTLSAGLITITNAAGKTFDGQASIQLPTDTISHWIADGTNYRGGRNGPRNLVGGNKVFASPADGSTNLMAPRALVAGDIPTVKGRLTENLITTNAFFGSGLNSLTIDVNALCTVGTTQYIGFIDKALKVNIAQRNLTTGAISTTVLTNTIADNDEHRCVSIAADSAGYLHVAYGMHISALRYIKSTAPMTLTFGGDTSMLGTHEDIVTYPMFVSNPTTRELYFTFRYKYNNGGDQYLYHYNTNTTSWEAASGTGTAGIIINGQTTSDFGYQNGLPRWDASGNLWFSWIWTYAASNKVGVMKWTGSAFQTYGGSALTIPATPSDGTVIATLATGPTHQSGFAIDTNGVLVIPYTRVDANTNSQEYVLESSTGSFVEHQLTRNIGYGPALETGPGVNHPYPVAMFAGGACYIIGPNSYGERGIIAYQSTNYFSTWTTFFPLPKQNPNWGFCYDKDRINSGIASFAYMESDDLLYQVAYLTPLGPVEYNYLNPQLGWLWVYDWVPSLDTGSSRGMPQDLVGLNSIQANTLRAGFIYPVHTNTTVQIHAPVATDSAFTFSMGGLAQQTASSGDFILASSVLFGWSSTGGASGTPDLYLTRKAPATLQIGTTAYSTVDQTFKGPDATSTDRNGGKLTIEAGSSTGTGISGALDFATGRTAESTGNTVNGYALRAHYNPKWITLTDSSAVAIETFSLAANKIIGGTITATCYVTNSVPHLQALTSTIIFQAVAVGTAITGTISQVDGTTAADSGTLTCAYTLVDNGANTFSIKATPVSNLATPTERCKLVVTALNGNDAVTITDP